jgi:hypothetical protein
MKQKVAVLYGIFAGPAAGRGVQKALLAAGYSLTTSAATADIIIAHSAGCFWLPPASPGQRYILIDPPYWPGQSVSTRAGARLMSHLHFHNYGYTFAAWCARNGWVIYYALRDAQRTFRIMRHARQFDLTQVIQSRDITLVRNQFDDWLTPNLAELQKQFPQLRIQNMPCDHDHLLYHPEAYINLLQSD